MSTPLGHRIYLGPKGMGDNSMFGKRMVSEAVEGPIRKTRVTRRRLNCLNSRVHKSKHLAGQNGCSPSCSSNAGDEE